MTTEAAWHVSLRSVCALLLHEHAGQPQKLEQLLVAWLR